MVGVLLALSADAWNEKRIERASEVRHLNPLREDFTESRELLTEWTDERWIFDGHWEIGSKQPRPTPLRDLETFPSGLGRAPEHGGPEPHGVQAVHGECRLGFARRAVGATRVVVGAVRRAAEGAGVGVGVGTA